MTNKELDEFRKAANSAAHSAAHSAAYSAARSAARLEQVKIILETLEDL